MNLHAYCIRSARDEPPSDGLRGVDGSPVTLVRSDDLCVWVSEIETLEATPATLREHEIVVREALRTATPLPFRFGMAFPTESALQEHLGSHAEEYGAALRDLAGHTELSLRIGRRTTDAVARPETPTVGEKTPGHQYLSAKRADIEDRRERRRLLEEIDSALSISVADRRMTVDDSSQAVGTLAHLVQNDHLLSYRKALRKLVKSRPDLDFHASGPWAPYSFVSR